MIKIPAGPAPVAGGRQLAAHFRNRDARLSSILEGASTRAGQSVTSLLFVSRLKKTLCAVCGTPVAWEQRKGGASSDSREFPAENTPTTKICFVAHGGVLSNVDGEGGLAIEGAPRMMTKSELLQAVGHPSRSSKWVSSPVMRWPLLVEACQWSRQAFKISGIP